MRRLDKEITDDNLVKEILDQSEVLRIAFAIDGVPHIVPVNFAHDNGRLYIHSARAGSKIEMISKNNHICFEMESYDEIIRGQKACNWTTKYRSVIGWGTIFHTDDREQKIKGLDLIMKKYGSKEKHTYQEAMLKSVVMIIIEIDKITGKQSGDWE